MMSQQRYPAFIKWPSAVVILLMIAAGGAGAGLEQPVERPFLREMEQIRSIGLSEEYAFDILKRLTALGPRLTASPQAAAAVDLMAREMEDLGFENVRLEPVTVGRWVRGDTEEARIVHSSQIGMQSLAVCALGGSVPTPPGGLTAPVVEVRSFDELHGMGNRIRGKIVFFNRPMDRTIMESFSAYGAAAEHRVRGAAEAARYGAAAVLIRSLTFRLNDHPHTGLLRYDENGPRIPAAAVSTLGADLLSALLKKEADVRVFLELTCETLSPVVSHNVIGEIRGSEFCDEIILVGGHLDSWDLGTGAHDDGAGCVQSIEVLRLIKKAGLVPRRTIRAVLFMDEEFGGTGGRAYAAAPGRKEERHLAAMESDRGGFLPIGIGAGADPSLVEKLRKLEYLWSPLGIHWVRTGGGGVDIAPLGEQGTHLMSVIPDAHRYFDVHHSALDVLDAVHPRELELGAVVMAVLAFILAQEGV